MGFNAALFGAITEINSLTGIVSLTAGNNVVISQTLQQLTFDVATGGGGIAAVQANTTTATKLVGEVIFESGVNISITTSGQVVQHTSTFKVFEVEDNAASATLTAVESGSIQTNVGVSGDIDLTLPLASIGLNFIFIQDMGPGFNFDILPGTNNTVQVSNKESAIGSLGRIRANKQAVLGLVAISNTKWVAKELIGIWNIT